MLQVASERVKIIQISSTRKGSGKMRRTLKMVEKGSVVLMAHGQPKTAVGRFTTFEDMRRLLRTSDKTHLHKILLRPHVRSLPISFDINDF
jgi:hypothetical protein